MRFLEIEYSSDAVVRMKKGEVIQSFIELKDRDTARFKMMDEDEQSVFEAIEQVVVEGVGKARPFRKMRGIATTGMSTDEILGLTRES